MMHKDADIKGTGEVYGKQARALHCYPPLSIDTVVKGVLSTTEPAVHDNSCWYVYFFFCFRGGVMGLPVLMPP